MDQILKNTVGEIRLELYDESGAAVNADSPPTVKVLDGAGAEHIATSTSSAVTTGVYALTIPNTKTVVCDQHTGVWTVVRSGQTNIFETLYEIVGAMYFTVSELRALDPALANTTKYTSAAIIDAREAVEKDIEAACGVAFVRRGARCTLDATGTSDLLLRAPEGGPLLFPRKLVSASIKGTALTAPQISQVLLGDVGRLRRDPDVGDLWAAVGDPTAAVAVHVEHGVSERPPPRIKRGAMLLVRSRLVPDVLTERATSMTNEHGTFTLATAGRRGSVFGLPELDAAIADNDYSMPAVG